MVDALERKSLLQLVNKIVYELGNSTYFQYLFHVKVLMYFLHLKFNVYDRMGDSVDHRKHFHQRMTLIQGNDVLLCHSFPSSLQGPTLAWIHYLSLYSISTFIHFIVHEFGQTNIGYRLYDKCKDVRERESACAMM